MPVKRRLGPTRRPDLEVLDANQQMHLLRGDTLFGPGFFDPETFCDAWELHREALTELFIAKYRDATFARPFGWWFCDHGKERPIVGRLSRVELQRREIGPKGIDRHFGYLWSHLYETSDLRRPEQEGEWDYLRRLRLLTAEEHRFLATLNRPRGFIEIG